MKRTLLLLYATFISSFIFSQNVYKKESALIGRVGPDIVIDTAQKMPLPIFDSLAKGSLRVVINGIIITNREDLVAFLKGKECISIRSMSLRKAKRLYGKYDHHDAVYVVNTDLIKRNNKIVFCPFLQDGHIVLWSSQSRHSIRRYGYICYLPRIIIDGAISVDSNDVDYFNILLERQFSRLEYLNKEKSEKQGFHKVPEGGILFVYHHL